MCTSVAQAAVVVGQNHCIVIGAMRSGGSKWLLDVIDSLGVVTRAESFSQLSAALHDHFVNKWEQEEKAVMDRLSFERLALLEVYFVKLPKGASKAKGKSVDW
jgi:hypothetical protein